MKAMLLAALALPLAGCAARPADNGGSDRQEEPGSSPDNPLPSPFNPPAEVDPVPPPVQPEDEPAPRPSGPR